MASIPLGSSYTTLAGQSRTYRAGRVARFGLKSGRCCSPGSSGRGNAASWASSALTC